MKQLSIYTAFPRGYCAGVHRAVGLLSDVVSQFPPPIFVNHAIIHNRFVVKMFERKGVVFESNLEKIPKGSLVIISAHGSGPSYQKQLRERGMRWIDATCPLVEKVHKEARSYREQGYHILYVGKKGHQEALGVMDEGQDCITLIENKEELSRFSSSKPLALLTQTTLSVDDTQEIIQEAKRIFPQIVVPKASDICYATTNRQNAVKVLAKKCDVVLVVGSKNSSNSNKLQSVASAEGKQAFLIDDANDIDPHWLDGIQSIGVTAGASGPEELVEGVIQKLKQIGATFVSELRITEEKMEFPYTLRIQY